MYLVYKAAVDVFSSTKFLLKRFVEKYNSKKESESLGLPIRTYVYVNDISFFLHGGIYYFAPVGVMLVCLFVRPPHRSTSASREEQIHCGSLEWVRNKL